MQATLSGKILDGENLAKYGSNVEDKEEKSANTFLSMLRFLA